MVYSSLYFRAYDEVTLICFSNDTYYNKKQRKNVQQNVIHGYLCGGVIYDFISSLCFL